MDEVNRLLETQPVDEGLERNALAVIAWRNGLRTCLRRHHVDRAVLDAANGLLRLHT